MFEDKAKGQTKQMLDGVPMKHSSTGIRGVTRVNVGRYRGWYCADIYATGYKRLWLGVYETIDEATMVRQRAEQLAKRSITQLVDWFDNQLVNPQKGTPYKKL